MQKPATLPDHLRDIWDELVLRKVTFQLLADSRDIADESAIDDEADVPNTTVE